MKRIFMFVTLLLTLLGASACGSAAPMRSPVPQVVATRVVEKEVMVEVPAQPALPAEESAGAAGPAPITTEALADVRKIIYEGNMYLVVEDTEKAAEEIQAMAVSAGGYVARMNGYRQGDRMVYDITIRVPAEKFENARISLRKLAVRVEREDISTQDVTDQYYDIEARLKTLKETEAELTELLRETRERGGDVDEIMKIYDRLTRLRADIESLQGQLNRLDKLVAFSTLNIHLEPHILTEPITPGDEFSLPEVIHSSVQSLIRILTGLLTLAIRFLIVVVPVLLILAIPPVLVLWLLYRWQQRRQKREKD
ncbi:MAG TPA: DUF4349 domain-containing protein [Anaerolineae bacterium]|nr:DUF4349 domain-containing protein [Anaerolineae bacterium]